MTRRSFTAWTSLLIGIISFLLSALPVTAAGKDHPALEQLFQDIQQLVNATSTVQCDFEQERNLSLFTQPIIFHGKMALVRLGKLRWENIEPIPSVLIFDGDKGMRCNDDAAPVHFELNKDPIMKMVAEQIWTWVDGDYDQLQSKYAITKAGEMTIQLVPRSTDSPGVIESVTVEFDDKTIQPKTILILETEGDSTLIRFSNYRLNETVADTLFTTCFP